MWLDRLATSARPSFAPRSSSALSLASSISNDSAVSTSGRRAGGANGSALRQSATVYSGPDPVDLLGRILEDAETVGGIAEKDMEESGEEVWDFGGLSLVELVLKAEEEDEEEKEEEEEEEDGVEVDGEEKGNVTGRARQIHGQTVEEYERDKNQLEHLHRSIRACDDVLSSVEANLVSFRNDLADVSADIETLQARSAALNVRLENRQAVEKGLGPLVDELSVSPMVVSKIVEGHIDEAWVKTLAEVDKRAAAYQKQQKGNASSLGGKPDGDPNSNNNSNNNITTPTTPQGKGLQDLGPLLEKLVLKAVERIRDFLVAQIKALRLPHINAQMIQQQNFIRFRELYAFLHRHHAKLADEIALAYRNTMRWYYHNHFSRYEAALRKMHLHFLDRSDLLGNEDTSRAKSSTATSASSSASSKISTMATPPHDAFNLGRRLDVLQTADTNALPSHLAEEDKTFHYIETPFRSFNLALIDNVAVEYAFLTSFFGSASGITPQAIARHFAYILEPTFTLGHTLTRTLTSDNYDALGLLLCVRLTQRFHFDLQRRRIPTADAYINGTSMLLWPRLQVVMDAHRESVRALAASLPQKPTAATKALPAAPHMATQRFGQLLHGILALSSFFHDAEDDAAATAAGASDSEPVVSSMRRLRGEMELFLVRYANGFGREGGKRDRFLYNNWSLVLTIVGATDLRGRWAEEELGWLERVREGVGG